MKKSRKQPRATIPEHLSPAAVALWERLSRDFVLTDAAAEALLLIACESFDRAAEARRIIAVEGTAVRDRFNQSRAHPMIGVERDARAQLISAIRALRLSPGDVL